MDEIFRDRPDNDRGFRGHGDGDRRRGPCMRRRPAAAGPKTEQGGGEEGREERRAQGDAYLLQVLQRADWRLHRAVQVRRSLSCRREIHG